MSRDAMLTAHLRAGASRPFSWGSCDCTLWVADWIKACRGIDPAAGWRGRYRTRIGAARLIRAAGGLDSLAGAALAQAGLTLTDMPRLGDIGLVTGADGAELLAIHVGTSPAGPQWAGKAVRGVAIAPLVHRLAWSL